MDPVIEIPEAGITLYPGTKVRLGRFNTTQWTVGYGWFSCSGNRETIGWYFTSDEGVVKPIQKTDLYDIYVVTL